MNSGTPPLKIVLFLFLLSCLASTATGQTDADKGLATAPPAPKALRYGVSDLKETAKDPGHPLADFVAERLNGRVAVPSVWADVAAHYVELGYHADAWAIQKAMLAAFVSGELSMPDESLDKLMKGAVSLPGRFRAWADAEADVFSLFDGRETSPRAAERLRRLAGALDRVGEKEKSLSLAGRFVAAYPDDLIGVEALKAAPAVAALYRQVATEGKGTRVGAAAQLKLGETLVRQNKFPEAVAAYKEYLETYPDGFDVPAALRTLAELCERTRDFDGAIRFSERLLKHVAGKDAIAISARAALLHHELGHHKEYVATYLGIGEKYGLWHPSDAARAILGGAEYAQEGNWPAEAAELYDACIRVVAQANNLPLDALPPSEAAPQERLKFWKACLNVRADGATAPDPAIAAFVEKNPRSREAGYARYVLSRLALDAGKVQEALDHAEALVGLLPDAPAAQRLAGEVRAKVGSLGHAHMERRAAHEDLGRADVGGLEGAEAVYRLAQFHAKAGRAAEAIENLSALAEEWPESPLASRALLDKAILYRDELEDSKKSDEALERALVLYPETDVGVTALQLLSKIEMPVVKQENDPQKKRGGRK